MPARLRRISWDSLRAKLLVMTLGPLVAALLVAGLLFLLVDRITVRQAVSENLVSVGQIIGSNSTAALAFGDTVAAEETLRALAVRRGVVLARLYDADGRVFAEYRRPGSPYFADDLGTAVPRTEAPAVFHDGHLHTRQSILLDGEPIGTVDLVSTLDEVEARRRRFLLLAVLVLAASAAVAILVSARLQNLVLRPVLSLVHTARAVSEGASYSLRADGTTTDELGLLVGAFNHMMDSIEERDAAVQAGRIELERRVDQRTADLRLSAERLEIRHEMDTAILGARSPEEIARAVLARISGLVPCTEARVIVIDRTSGRARTLAAVPQLPLGAPPDEASSEELGDIEALRRGELQIVAVSDRSGTGSAVAETMAFINVPMRAQDELIGVLSVGLEDGSQSLPRHGRILNDLAISLAIAIRQAWLFQQTVESAETKTRLLEEINHRVKNNLASIVGLIYAELRRGKVGSEDCREVLHALRSRVEGLSAVHSMLSASGWAPLPLADVAQQVVRTALRIAPRSTLVTLEVDRSPITVTSSQATSFAIVLNELATNVIKHATEEPHEVHLRLAVRRDDGGIVLDLQDDGPGYPDDVLSGKRRGLGLYLVEEMVRGDLGGELELHNDGGARTSIRFPRNKRMKERYGAFDTRKVVAT